MRRSEEIGGRSKEIQGCSPAMVAKDANSLRTSLRRQRPPWRLAKTPAYFCLPSSFFSFPSWSRLRDPPPPRPVFFVVPPCRYTHGGDTSSFIVHVLGFERLVAFPVMSRTILRQGFARFPCPTDSQQRKNPSVDGN